MGIDGDNVVDALLNTELPGALERLTRVIARRIQGEDHPAVRPPPRHRRQDERRRVGPHPTRILLTAVIGTQVLATGVAASGLLMHPLRWDLIALAWGRGSSGSSCSTS